MSWGVRMQYKTIGEICTVVSGTTPKSDKAEYWGGNLIWITPAELKEGNAVIYDSVRHITKAAVKASALKPFPKGTVILSSRAPIGKVAIAGTKMYCNQGFKNLICSEAIYNGYLYYYLKAKTAYLNSLGRGATFREISKQIVEKIKIPVPSMQEQHRIADILFKIDALMGKRQRQAEKLDELVKARFVEMFGDPVRNTKHWEKASLLALGSCKNGMSFHANESGIKLRCLGVGDFKNLSYIDDVEQLPFVSLAEKPSANCFLHDGDIVFVRSNGNKALVGRCLLVYPRDTPTIYSGFCIRYRLVTEKVDPIYALHVLKADGIRQKMSGRGANIQNLNQKILAAIEMPIPPLPLQNAFATFVHEVDREKERIQRSAALLETLKRSLMQQYFG